MKNRVVPVCCLLLAAIIFPACRGTQKAPPQPQKIQRSAVPANLTERFIHQLIYNLRDRFVAGDVDGFMRNISDGFYGGRSSFESDLVMTLNAIYAVNVEVVIETVKIEENVITAFISWSRSAINRGSGIQEKRVGKTQLVFHRGEKVSLVSIRRDPLFGITKP